MTQLKRQIIAVLAAGSTALSGLAPAVVASEITISGNGSNSNNTVTVQQTGTTTVIQENTAFVTNTVTSNSSTGGNVANDNTGGDVMVRTGDARNNTVIENTLNNNMAHVGCCEPQNMNVTVSGNGSNSDNTVNLTTGNARQTQIFQDNLANVGNVVNSTAGSGGNATNRNTGGNVSVRTGDASTGVAVSTTANANVATVGGEGQRPGSLSARIMGNGSQSDNSIQLTVGRNTAIVQDNNANVLNQINSNASTGANAANDNTGGNVMIHTGSARAMVGVDNMVNFNAADIDCGCLMNISAKVAENGTGSDNLIDLGLGGNTSVFQGGQGAGNFALLTNLANGNAGSGSNAALFNTGNALSDPSIMTGHGWSYTEVSNTGNLNVFGGRNWTWPMIEWHWSFAHLFAR